MVMHTEACITLKSTPKLIWEERVTLVQVCKKYLLVSWDAPYLPPKLPIPLRRSPSPSNTPIPWPTPLIIPNGIRIHSAILPQYTFRTEGTTHTHPHPQIDRWDRWQVYSSSIYTLLIVSDVLKTEQVLTVYSMWHTGKHGFSTITIS